MIAAAENASLGNQLADHTAAAAAEDAAEDAAVVRICKYKLMLLVGLYADKHTKRLQGRMQLQLQIRTPAC